MPDSMSHLGEAYLILARIGLRYVERQLAEGCADRERRLRQRAALLALLGDEAPVIDTEHKLTA